MIEVKCPCSFDSTKDCYVDGHAILKYKMSNGFTRYRCAICDSEFQSPEEQDINFLPDREYAVISTLQRMFLEKSIEK